MAEQLNRLIPVMISNMEQLCQIMVDPNYEYNISGKDNVEFLSYYSKRKTKKAFDAIKGMKCSTGDDIYELSCLLFENYYKTTRKEHYLSVFLDDNNKVVALETMAIGSTKSVTLNNGTLISYAQHHVGPKAKVITVHNHNDCDTYPSDADDRHMDSLVECCKSFRGIILLDHLIIRSGSCEDCYYSYTETMAAGFAGYRSDKSVENKRNAIYEYILKHGYVDSMETLNENYKFAKDYSSISPKETAGIDRLPAFDFSF